MDTIQEDILRECSENIFHELNNNPNMSISQLQININMLCLNHSNKNLTETLLEELEKILI